jgi:hypothetical protein
VIKRVQIQNFRALLEIDVELRPLAVLVGPNDSGKSSFLEAIRRRLTGSIEREDGWRGVQQAVVQLYGTQGSPFRGSAEIFKLPSQGIPMESAGVAEEPRKGAPQLTVDGSNLAAFLDYPLRKDRRRFDQVQTTLRSLIPGAHPPRPGPPCRPRGRAARRAWRAYRSDRGSSTRTPEGIPWRKAGGEPDKRPRHCRHPKPPACVDPYRSTMSCRRSGMNRRRSDINCRRRPLNRRRTPTSRATAAGRAHGVLRGAWETAHRPDPHQREAGARRRARGERRQRLATSRSECRPRAGPIIGELRLRRPIAQPQPRPSPAAPGERQGGSGPSAKGEGDARSPVSFSRGGRRGGARRCPRRSRASGWRCRGQ